MTITWQREKMKEFRIFGPPGTGKTTQLVSREIPKSVEKYGAENVLVASYTKTAAREIISKASRETGETISVPRENVGTLHSLCYRQLGKPGIAETKKDLWNETYGNIYPMGYNSGGAVDTGIDEAGKSGLSGDVLLGEYNIRRAKMKTKTIPMTIKMAAFVKKWEQFKKDNGFIDFTDMIELASMTTTEPPNNTKILFFDEAQDFTPLQFKLIRQWGKHADWVVLAGDDDQCQPAGTMVLTTNGYKAIEKLDPVTDRLAVYDRRGAIVYPGTSNGGKRFKITSRSYFDYMYNVVLETKRTKATNNHKWMFKWTDQAKANEITVVYLMKKENRYRVGWCQLFRADGCFHLGVRARLEKADAAWILKVCSNKAKASVYESYFAVEYGITTMPFVPHGEIKGGYYSTKNIDEMFSMLDQFTQKERAHALLSRCGRYPDYPIWTARKAYENRGGCTINVTETCNLIPELMSLPVHMGGTKTKWKPIKSCSRIKVYNETVYSLDVEKYHTYITDGIITHNCLFSFTGATPNAFLKPPIDDKFKRILKQSYRVPKKVFEKANRIIKRINFREPKDYRPRDAEGTIKNWPFNYGQPENYVGKIIDQANTGKTVMVLASCSYMINPIRDELKSRGVPFHNPYRKRRGDWNPLSGGEIDRIMPKDVIVNFLASGVDEPYWNAHQFISWAKFLTVSDTGLIRKKGKKIINQVKSDLEAGIQGLHSCRNFIRDVISPDGVQPAINRNLEWLTDNLQTEKKKKMEYPLKVYEKFGEKGLTQKPKIIIGTIHSVKGGEATSVWLHPDISYQASQQAIEGQAHEDAISRMFYVGVTRAFEELNIMAPRINKIRKGKMLYREI